MSTIDSRAVLVGGGRRTGRSRPQLRIDGDLPYLLEQSLMQIPGIRHTSGRLWLPKEPRLLELLLRELPSAAVHVTDDVRKWYNQILKAEKKRVALTLLEDIDLPGVDDRLRSFQRVGVNFILQSKRCILADDIGLGKTAQILEAIRRSEWHHRILVVCTNSSKWWWREEIEKWFPGQLRVVVEAATREDDLQRYGDRAGFLIINWALVRLIPELKRWSWHWIVADEAHYLKNRKTQRWAHFKELVTRNLVMLTGTPIANMPADLWALLHLLRPEMYPSYWRFYEMYVNYYTDWHGYKKINRANSVRNADLLQREIAPILLRRSKEKYRETLPPQNKVIPVPLTPVQAKMYKTMATQMFAALEDDREVEVFDVGAQITRLRQIISTTATLQKSDHSSKLDAAVDLIVNAPGEQFVVFALFRATVFALQRRLLAKDITCALIIGGQPPEDRFNTVTWFQANEIRVIASTVQAGGESLTLTASHQVVFIEKHFSYIVQQQAIGRVDRFGQTKQCQVTSIVCPHTIDALVERIVASKSKMVDKILMDAFFENLQDSLAYL